MSRFEVVVRWCTTCEDDVMFEQPGCRDDHDGDCPEWTCVQCGDALFVGFGPVGPVLLSGVASSVA